jgi:mRNA interferase MazF
MSANNYIQIKEISSEQYHVSERDYDTDGEIQSLGIFDAMRMAVKKAEKHIQESECGVEYGVSFSLMEEPPTHKDFDLWNTKKKLVNSERSRLYTVREVWWCRIGINVGSEQDGNGKDFLRPVLIIRGFGADTCMVIPLTTSLRQHFLRVPVGIIQGKSASALLSQIRVIDTRRLVEKIGFLEKDLFQELRKTVKDLL